MTTSTPDNWLRWMQDPAEWETFYNGANLRTFAALAKELWSGRDPAGAVEAAIDDVAACMARGGVPEDVIAAYRDENLRHREHLAELAGEIDEMLDKPARPKRVAGPTGVAHAESTHTETVEAAPYLWAAQAVTDGVLQSLEMTVSALATWHHQIAEWGQLVHPSAHHRWHAARFRSPSLTAHYGRRAHDVDVERL